MSMIFVSGFRDVSLYDMKSGMTLPEQSDVLA